VADFSCSLVFCKYGKRRTKLLDRYYGAGVNTCRLRHPPMVRSGKKIHPRRSDETPSELISLGLTKREAEVLAWIARGKGNYDIGVILGTKRRTISKHVEHIFAKLNVENRTAAAVVALQCVDESRGRLGNKWRGSHTAIIAFVLARLSELWSDLGEVYTAMGALIDGCGS